MIKFVTVDKIRPGVTLARDIYGIDTFTNRVVMLKAGQELTVGHITKLMSLDLQGVYINERVEAPEIVPSRTRDQMVKLIKDLYNFVEEPTSLLYTEKISATNDILEHAIDDICTRKDFSLSVDSFNFHDNDKYNHTMSVAVICIAIGKELRMPKQSLLDLTVAAILHDVGDSKIPQELLEKPAKLSPEEFEPIKEHSQFGHDIISEISGVSEHVKEGVLRHHERFDGSGYPGALSGKSIPLFSRIIAVADVYSALTSQRPYRDAYSPAEAIEYIMGNAGRQFDSGVVKAFLKCISPYAVGSCVKLSNGEKAVVADQNPDNPLRPTIFLMDDPTVMIDLYNDRRFFNIVISETIND